jgi:copper chaperone CopZ
LLALLAQLGWRRWRARRASRALQAAADGHSLVLQVQGMSCQHCVGSVKRALEAVDTVTEATPDLASGRVRITGGGFAVPALVRAIEEAGFTVNGVETGPRRVDASKSVS